MQYFTSVSNPRQNTPKFRFIKQSPPNYKFPKSLPVSTHQSHLSPNKSYFSLTKNLPYAQRCTQPKRVIQTKPEQQRALRYILQGVLSLRKTANPAPKPDSNLQSLPCAVGLERSSLSVTWPKTDKLSHASP